MNCKQGDLAIIVKSYAGNEGKIVRCVKFIPSYAFGPGVFPAWQLDEYYPSDRGGFIDKAPDAWLRPIRDTDKEDEMLRITGKPEKVTA